MSVWTYQWLCHFKDLILMANFSIETSAWFVQFAALLLITLLNLTSLRCRCLTDFFVSEFSPNHVIHWLDLAVACVYSLLSSITQPQVSFAEVEHWSEREQSDLLSCSWHLSLLFSSHSGPLHWFLWCQSRPLIFAQNDSDLKKYTLNFICLVTHYHLMVPSRVHCLQFKNV